MVAAIVAVVVAIPIGGWAERSTKLTWSGATRLLDGEYQRRRNPRVTDPLGEPDGKVAPVVAEPGIEYTTGCQALWLRGAFQRDPIGTAGAPNHCMRPRGVNAPIP